VVAIVRFHICDHKNKQAKILRIKLLKLKGKTSIVFKERSIKECIWKEEDGVNNMWGKMITCILKVASEVCGATKGSSGKAKETWWWHKEVQRAIKERKNAIYVCIMARVWTI
jgi:hypothetical protein